MWHRGLARWATDPVLDIGNRTTDWVRFGSKADIYGVAKIAPSPRFTAPPGGAAGVAVQP